MLESPSLEETIKDVRNFFRWEKVKKKHLILQLKV